MKKTKLRIIVTGYVGCVPVGGVAWDYLQYAVGLARLGHDVIYHEDTNSWPYDPIKRSRTFDYAYSTRYIQDFFRHYAPQLEHRWHYRHLKDESAGMSQQQFNDFARTADIFLNISGASSVPEDLPPSCTKVFVDTDPGYNQILMQDRLDRTATRPGYLRTHDQFFTYAENINGVDCLIPRIDVAWKITRMPVVLDLWHSIGERAPDGAHWTTVMSWSRFKNLSYKGVIYRGKGHELERFIQLPKFISVPITIALGGENAPVQQLLDNDWNITDGPKTTRTPENYQAFIANSRGEVSVAKHVYVALRTGWFSCRSACYLAAGRPVIVQDTGFRDTLPDEKGMLAYSTLDEAIACVHEIESDHPAHAKGAREYAKEHFDSDKVLSELIANVSG